MCRDDLEQARILADQVQRREKLRKRALISWQQNMRLLAARASALDKQKAGTAASSPSKGHTTSIKKALSSFDELAESEEEMRGKFQHDMALSLQLTQGVAEEAGKLQHVKIVRAQSSQPLLGSDAASLRLGSDQGQDAADHATTEVAAGQLEVSQHADAFDSTDPQEKSPGNALTQSPSRRTRSMLAHMADAATEHAAVVSTGSLQGKSPQPSPLLTPSRLTRSSEAHLPNAEQRSSALPSANGHPRAAKTPTSASAGSQHQWPEPSLQPASPRMTRSMQAQGADADSSQAASRSPAQHSAVPRMSAVAVDMQQACEPSLQLSSPRLTRSMQADLANVHEAVDNSPAG